jgi:hypothetical protein
LTHGRADRTTSLVESRASGCRLRGLFHIPGGGAGIAIRRGRDTRLVTAGPATRRRALGAPAPDPGGGGILELLAHAVELGRVIRAESTALEGRLRTMTSTTTTHRHLIVANANACSGRS